MINKRFIIVLLVLSIVFSLVSTLLYFSDVYAEKNSYVNRYSPRAGGNPSGGFSLVIEGDTSDNVIAGEDNGK